MIIYGLLVVALAACEVRWRLAWMRIPLVILAVLELQFATGLGPAYRRSLAQPQHVVMPTPPSQPQRMASEYVSGVLVMRKEAERDLTGINFPLGILVWFALYPAMLPLITRVVKQVQQSRGTSE